MIAEYKSLNKATSDEKAPFAWEGKDASARDKVYDEYAKVCLLRKVGEVEDIAQAVTYLLLNKYTTGSTLYPDGGFTLR